MILRSSTTPLFLLFHHFLFLLLLTSSSDAQFVEECGPSMLPLGGGMSGTYSIGHVAGVAAIEMTVSFASGYGAVGFRAVDATGMENFDIFAFDSTIINSVMDCTLMKISGMPTPDATNNLILTAHSGTTVTFHRLLDTGDSEDFVIPLDTDFSFGWASGSGAAGTTWQMHTAGNVGKSMVNFASCPASTLVPAQEFTASCGPIPIETGEPSMKISYELGDVVGKSAIQFQITYVAGYGAVGWRADNVDRMEGLDIYAFDRTFPTQINDFQPFSGTLNQAPTAKDALSSAVIVSHENGDIVFYRLLDTNSADDVPLVGGGTYGFAWAIGSGAVADLSWAKHSKVGRLSWTLPQVQCRTDAPETPSPPTPSPPTLSPPTPSPPTPSPPTNPPLTEAPPTGIPGVPETVAPDTPVPTPADVFVMQCKESVATSADVTIEYAVGQINGVDAIQFTVEWVGDYGAVGLRGVGAPMGMAGLDVYAFDTKTVDAVLDSKLLGGNANPIADATQSATVVSNVNSKIIFHRLMDTKDFEDYSITRSQDLTIAWATGPGFIADDTWTQHSAQQRGTVDITVASCNTLTPPTDAPATEVPDTHSPALLGEFVADQCPARAVTTGSNSFLVSYQYGTFEGVEAIRFDIRFEEDWGSIAFRDIADSTSGMAGFDGYAFDAFTANVKDLAVAGAVNGRPADDPIPDAYLSPGAQPSQRVSFFRKVDTGNDYVLSKGSPVTIGWAVGPGRVFGTPIWAGHSAMGRGVVNEVLLGCTAAPTNAPPTVAPDTIAPTAVPTAEPTDAPDTAVPPPTTLAPTNAPPSFFPDNTSCTPNGVFELETTASLAVSYEFGMYDSVPAVRFTAVLQTGDYGAIGFRDPGGNRMDDLDVYAWSSANQGEVFDGFVPAGVTDQPTVDTAQDAVVLTQSADTITFVRPLVTATDFNLRDERTITFAWAVGYGNPFLGTWRRHSEAAVLDVRWGCPAPPTDAPDTPMPTVAAPTTTPTITYTITTTLTLTVPENVAPNMTDECASTPCGEGQTCTDEDSGVLNDFVCVCVDDVRLSQVGRPAPGCIVGGAASGEGDDGGLGLGAILGIVCAALCLCAGAVCVAGRNLKSKPKAPVEHFTEHLDEHEGELDEYLAMHPHGLEEVEDDAL